MCKKRHRNHSTTTLGSQESIGGFIEEEKNGPLHLNPYGECCALQKANKFYNISLVYKYTEREHNIPDGK